MKKIHITSVILSAFLLASCGEAAMTNTKTPYEIEVIKAGDLTKSITLEKSALMKAGTQVTLTAQAGGRVGSVFVKPGDTVAAWEVIVQIEDVYGSTNNAREEAAIALESAQLTLSSTTLSLDQSLASAKIAYEKAEKDYEATRLQNTANPWEPSKAQLDYENYVTTQENTLAGYEVTYQSQLQSFQSFLANVIDTTDTIMGVSESKKNQNNSYEFLLGISATDGDKRNIAEQNIRILLGYKNWTPSNSTPLTERLKELQKVYDIANITLKSVEDVLSNTIADGTYLTSTNLNIFKSTIDGLQTQYTTSGFSLVSYLNAAQTFLATYEKERLSRQKSIQTAEENSRDGLQLAKNAYETAEKTRALTLKQMNQNISSASVRLRNAQGNINRLSITAPVDGVVWQVRVDIGEEITAGKPVIDIASRDAECDITVDSGTLAQLQIGAKVNVNYRGQKLPGTIMSVSPIADNGLNFAVKIGVNADVSIFGDFATIDIPMSSVFPTVPITAVTILAPGQWEIWILSTDDAGAMSVKKKSVILGNLWNDRVEITSELEANEMVILSDMKNYNPVDFELQKKVRATAEPL